MTPRLRTTVLLMAVALAAPALMAEDEQPPARPAKFTLAKAEPVKTASGKAATAGNNYSRAFFADIDGDGTVDMVTADVFGKLRVFKGTTARGAPFSDSEPLKLADGRPASRPTGDAPPSVHSSWTSTTTGARISWPRASAGRFIGCVVTRRASSPKIR